MRKFEKGKSLVSLSGLPARQKIQRGIINRSGNLWRACVYISSYRRQRDVTRFVAMLDFYHPSGFAVAFLPRCIFMESKRYFCYFSLAQTGDSPCDISLSASSVTVRSFCVRSFFFFFFKLVKLYGFIFNASSAFWNYMQINRIVIICTFVQYLARIAREFFKHFCAYRSDIVESSLL